MREEARLGGGQERIDQQHARGKLTARERIELLLDADSFVELDAFVTNRNATVDASYLGDGVVTGHGAIDGRTVFVFSQDFTVFGGSLSEAYAEKICKIMDLAMKVGAPIIGLNDSGGARIQEGVVSLGGYADIFLRNTLASGVVPQLSGDPRAMRRRSGLFAGDHGLHDHGRGDELHVRDRAECREGRDPRGRRRRDAWRRDDAHDPKWCALTWRPRTEASALASARQLLAFLPQNNLADAPSFSTTDPVDRMDETLDAIIPDDPAKPYDMHGVIERIVDDGAFTEIQPGWAQNIITGFARLNGRSIGVVAQQPAVLAGALDIAASTKAARFVRTCDCFNVPLLTLVDVPGFLPGVGQEHGGIIRHGAKLLYAYCEATVPKITVITRKAYGGAYDVMSSKHVRGDINLAWPTAEIAVMGAEGAVNILYRDEIASSDDASATRERLVREYEERFANPYVAAARGYVDDVIRPSETRPRLIAALEMLADKRDTNPPKKHGNIPL
jgi:propionyl-CoA carboxylase beta chain